MSRQSYVAQRARTLDRGPPDANRAPVYTVGVIGEKRKTLADGSLLCEDVPIARTGNMMYAPGDLPMLRPPTRPGAAQVLYVTRDAVTLFAPQSLGSAIGAAVTLDHPPVDVDPMNWNQLAKGFVLDAWQGQGEDRELMFADIVIKDKYLIEQVNSGKLREVSLGYTASYEQTGDGEGRQRDIIINHLALVEKGRCGPRCAIGDRQSIDKEETTMPQPQGNGARPRNRLDAVRAALEEVEQQENEEGVHVHVHMPAATRDGATVEDELTPDEDGVEARISSIEDGMLEMRAMLQEALARPRTTDSATIPPAGDSAALDKSFQQMIARAEILVPGFRAPTFDSALSRAKTVDSMCATRRQVLTTLAATTDGAALINAVADDGFDVAAADCAAVAVAFNAAASVKAANNTRAVTGDRLTVPQAGAGVVVVPSGGVKQISDAELNKLHQEYWSKN